ncbi:MAG: N-formylglutamate amidohydrolase [Desulfobacteraceae bacterium]|nr:N-formylglutamate amidohydrolase [Desulfobacteraceae bacterium]
MRLPFVISVPHCSGRIPEGIRADFALSNDEIADSIDLGTREIFGSLDAGDILCSEWSRLVVDLNRDPERRDHKGVIARIDYFGRSIYHENAVPDGKEISGRLREYYRPYHNRLREALARPDIKGVIDCHSVSGIGPSEAPDAGKKRKDIILSNNGDSMGKMTPALGNTTCPSELLNLMKQVFLRAGFSVSINSPYTAGFISTHYGHAFAGREKFAVQIEINQDLYAGPGTGKVAPGRLADVRSRVCGCLDEIAEMI